MSDPARRFALLIAAAGMILVRTKKHAIYKHPDGRTFAASKSPSDIHSRKNELKQLERFLGLRPSADKGAHL